MMTHQHLRPMILRAHVQPGKEHTRWDSPAVLRGQSEWIFAISESDVRVQKHAG
jgi:hypothetical protein